ncbi:LytR family transcriptional regulator [Nocardioides immobilis]|uniref:LytR family transcriptional regulator n=1 Tax=Nocardioides immobilis TaxID=2049295 RepID=A0A417Y8G8_9ACTN|nr:LCP family protein [Nocardioides immobilis]RHW28727.1 LytR family transcriptional regulator [Nocardioides immobilis]
MAERPSGPPAGAGGDDRDFDWMYGDRPAGTPPPTRPTPRQPPPPAENRPEPTRMLPAQPRPPAARPEPAQRPSPAAPAPPYQPPVSAASTGRRPPTSGGGSRSRWSRPRTWITLVLVLILLWLVYVVAVPFFTWTKVDKIAFEPDGDRPDDQPGTTYLMVGNDSRAGLTEEERKKYNTGNPESSLADTIIMLHTGSGGPDVMVSFPRDWIIDGNKINGLWDPGDPTRLVAALEQETGIRIDEYVEIGLGGVAGVVDAVGGIEICPKEKIKDPKAGLDLKKKGCQEADGEVALAYARTRATTRGDLDRVGRQREVIAAIGDKVLSPWSVINPIRWWRLNSAIPDFFAFGEGTGQTDVGRWALAIGGIGDGGLTCTMPVTDGSANTIDRDRADPLFDAIIEDRTDDITKKQCTAAGVAE